ncbi:MAG: hypothetical protein IKR19_08870 [Acholeplasmatales bacterium]|nr:hypothetical protein [Acholeplasmatales bacterium]
MKVLLVGVGAAGNKAVMNAVDRGTVKLEDTMIVNSTSKDFPSGYEGKKIVLSQTDTGCGKERPVANEYAQQAMNHGLFTFDNMGEYITVVVVTSVEGGTGSGASPIIAKMFSKVYNKNVHILAFTGFEDDVRGLSNTVEFFKEIDSALIVQTVSNAHYLQQAGGNKLRAEELANNEMAERIRVITGQDFIPSEQNIDDTDIIKLANTSGYMTVEKKYLNKALETREDFNKTIKNMIYNSATIKVKDPCAVRIGIILNLSPESVDAIDGTYEELKSAYGAPYEFFTQQQWDGKKEYIAYIVSGMKMPIDEIQEVYDRYLEQTAKINKNDDEFFTNVKGMATLEEDSKFNMIKNASKGMSIADFLNSQK